MFGFCYNFPWTRHKEHKIRSFSLGTGILLKVNVSNNENALQIKYYYANIYDKYLHMHFQLCTLFEKHNGKSWTIPVTYEFMGQLFTVIIK